METTILQGGIVYGVLLPTRGPWQHQSRRCQSPPLHRIRASAAFLGLGFNETCGDLSRGLTSRAFQA